MCGIVGFLSAAPDRLDTLTLRRMADAIAYRGPDDAGYWTDPEHGIALGHRRLAVVDLSASGHQPMVSACGRYVLVFNGEIYNHAALRQALGAWTWRGQSDTETLLACITRHGTVASLPLLCGMFAFAVWDRQTDTLTLVRDRLGEKPLYFGWQGQGGAAVFLFGSELKALKAHPAFCAEINRDAICLLMRHNCIAAPHTIYQGIHKLEPGCWLSLSLRQPALLPGVYWSATDVARDGTDGGRFTGSPEQAVDGLEQVLGQAVGQQMVADVPLGAFLSGGIDSSAVVALMQARSARPVRTFSIGFDEAGYNESAHARAVARHLGTTHTELIVTASAALALIPRLPILYDEPFSDSSQIPTWLVSQLARQQVTVALSGDGGDELFCGYPRYPASARRWRQLSRLPLGWRRQLSAALQRLPAGWLDGERRSRAQALLGCTNVDAVYRCIVSHWQNPAAIVPGAIEPATRLSTGLPALTGLDNLQRMMALDRVGYLPDDILTKLDRAAMSVSLETRVPMLDHRVVEFASRLPLDCLLRDGQSKWVLRQVLYRYLPRQLVDRPKMGFAVPLAAWLRGPLRDWAEALLDPATLRHDGWLDPVAVRDAWAQHLKGRDNRVHQLWNVLMFQAWLHHHAA